MSGALVVRRVGQEHRQDNADVRIPDQNMAEGRVRDLANRHECAIQGNAPVCLNRNWKINIVFVCEWY